MSIPAFLRAKSTIKKERIPIGYLAPLAPALKDGRLLSYSDISIGT
jgi:hypothetical protein